MEHKWLEWSRDRNDLFQSLFNVDFTKGKFKGDKDFDELLDLLQDHCDSDDFPLLRQAKNYRKPQPKINLKDLATKGVKDYKETLENSNVKESVEIILKEGGKDDIDENKKMDSIPEDNKLQQITEEFDVEGAKWIVELDLVDSETVRDWIEIVEEEDVSVGVRKIRVRLSLIHPFMSSFGTNDIQPFIRLAMAFALSESLARMSSGSPGSVRRNLNKFLNTEFAR